MRSFVVSATVLSGLTGVYGYVIPMAPRPLPSSSTPSAIPSSSSSGTPSPSFTPFYVHHGSHEPYGPYEVHNSNVPKASSSTTHHVPEMSILPVSTHTPTPSPSPSIAIQRFPRHSDIASDSNDTYDIAKRGDGKADKQEAKENKKADKQDKKEQRQKNREDRLINPIDIIGIL